MIRHCCKEGSMRGSGPDDREPEQRGGSPWDRRLDSRDEEDSDQPVIKAVRIDFGKRLVAAMIDLVAANVISYVVLLIPFVSSVVSPSLPVCAVLLVRDWFYEGRGIGKNLMGLQVVSVSTGRPATLWQSVKRNIVILGAPLVLYIILTVFNILTVFKVPGLPVAHEMVVKVVEIIGFLYLLAAVPYEVHRAYNRPDGLRLGDQFAGTTIVEAPMDFSCLLPGSDNRRITRR
jgi:uncharacterized RDD family membrane protein YckC